MGEVKNKNMKPLTFTLIESKIAELIKADIKKKGLVKTGNMLNSITVKSSNGGFTVQAVDYFEFVDEKYNILDDVFGSDAFVNLLIDEASDQILEELI
jgi:hypothetical protein